VVELLFLGSMLELVAMEAGPTRASTPLPNRALKYFKPGRWFNIGPARNDFNSFSILRPVLYG
jgi:hypothetical protein